MPGCSDVSSPGAATEGGIYTAMNLQSLAPWDRLPHFLPPKETEFAVPATATRVANADPSRVMIAFALGVSSTVSLSTKPSVVYQHGVTLTQFLTFISFNIDDHGPLVNSEWWAISGGPAVLTVWEASIARWDDTGKRQILKPMRPLLAQRAMKVLSGG